MKLLQKLSGSKAKIILIIIFLLLLVYIVAPGFFFKSESGVPFLSSFFDFYIVLIEKFVSSIVNLTGTDVIIDNHTVVLNGGAAMGFSPMIYFKKWLLLFVMVIWITRTKWGEKVLFTAILIIVHFLVNSIYIATDAILTGSGNSDQTLLSIPLTFGMLCLFTIIFIWYRKHKEVLLGRLSKFRINTKLFQSDLRFGLVAYSFIIIYYLLSDIFDYQLWISFLFTSSKAIIGLFGYSATVEPFYLIGDNGSIFMLKSCIGFHTMLLFGIIIILTGNTTNKIRWIYIFSGFLFLNFANIMRFVLLFIHIQKHGDYMLAMDVHDMYNYIIYGIVFIMWVIWFEKFAESKKIDERSLSSKATKSRERSESGEEPERSSAKPISENREK